MTEEDLYCYGYTILGVLFKMWSTLCQISARIVTHCSRALQIILKFCKPDVHRECMAVTCLQATSDISAPRTLAL